MKRFVVVLTVWMTGLAGVLGSVFFPVASASAALPAVVPAAVSTPGGFTSVAPFRLLDTRSGLGAPKGAVAPGGTVVLQVAGQGGVPLTGVSAVVLNVTVADPTASGYVTVYGDGTTRPTASNLNYVKDQVVPNLVIAPLGAGGKVDLFNGSPGTADLVADVSGYFLSGVPTASGAFVSLAPSRLLDTRSGLGLATGAGAVAPSGTVALQVAGRGGVPLTGVSAVVLNVTVAEPTSSGFVTVFGDGATRPTASNLNFVKDQVVPNLVVAPVGADGQSTCSTAPLAPHTWSPMSPGTSFPGLRWLPERSGPWRRSGCWIPAPGWGRPRARLPLGGRWCCKSPARAGFRLLVCLRSC